MFVCLSGSLSVCVSVCRSVSLSVWPRVLRNSCLSFSGCPTVGLSDYLAAIWQVHEVFWLSFLSMYETTIHYACIHSFLWYCSCHSFLSYQTHLICEGVIHMLVFLCTYPYKSLYLKLTIMMLQLITSCILPWKSQHWSLIYFFSFLGCKLSVQGLLGKVLHASISVFC